MIYYKFGKWGTDIIKITVNRNNLTGKKKKREKKGTAEPMRAIALARNVEASMANRAEIVRRRFRHQILNHMDMVLDLWYIN